VKVTGQAMPMLDIARDEFRANETILYRPVPYRVVNDLAEAFMSRRFVNEFHVLLSVRICGSAKTRMDPTSCRDPQSVIAVSPKSGHGAFRRRHVAGRNCRFARNDGAITGLIFISCAEFTVSQLR
jgi:hypothetical protein